MSTNTSQNLGLHLWEPTDQVLRTEFNQNWQKIDTAVNTAQETAEAAYSPNNKPAEIKQVTVSSAKAAGDTVLTLDYTPSFAILSNYYGTEVIGSGSVGHLYFSSISTTAYTMQFQLVGKQLMLFSRGDSLTGSYSFSLAIFR